MFNTIKKHLSKTLFVAVLGLVSALPAQAAIMLSFQTASTSVDVNDTFTVDLLVSNDPQILAEGITAWDLDLFFDSALFQLDNVAVNAALFLPTSLDLDGIGGTVFGFPPVPLFGTDITLATFTFTALSAGTSDFATGFDFGEGFFGDFFAPINPASVVNASLNITANAPAIAASAPASAAILIMAIAGLLLRRRK